MRRLGLQALLLLGVILVVLPATPAIRPVPGIDSGVFNYVAWRMTQGEVPYRDVWDHKPPVIFFFDLAGLLLGRGTPWGSCILFGLLLAIGTLAGFDTLRRPFGDVAAFAGMALGLLAMMRINSSSILTEEFVMVGGFPLLALYHHSLLRGPSARKSLAIGLLTALLFFTKQTNIGIPLAIVLALTFHFSAQRRFRELVTGAAWVLSGFALVAGALVAYFASHGALRDFWDAAFAYNFGYSSSEPGEALLAAWQGRIYFTASGILFPALLGVPLGIFILRTPAYRAAYGDPLISAALLAWPIELALSGLSGRAYNHYFYVWIPAMTVLAALAFSAFLAGFPDPVGRPRLRLSAPVRAAVLAGFLLASAISPLNLLRSIVLDLRSLDLVRNQVLAVDFLSENTLPEEPVLLWGAQSGVQFTARRRSPSRFVYQWPLFEPYHPAPDVVDQFRADLEADPPVLVIDTSELDPRTPPLDPGRYEAWLADGVAPPPRAGIREIAEDLFRDYVYVGRLMYWHVYAQPGRQVRLPEISPRDARRLRYRQPIAPSHAGTGLPPATPGADSVPGERPESDN